MAVNVFQKTELLQQQQKASFKTFTESLLSGSWWWGLIINVNQTADESLLKV